MSSVKNWVLLSAAAILYLAAKRLVRITSPEVLQTYKCLQFSHQGKKVLTWCVQEYFVKGGWVLFASLWEANLLASWENPHPYCLSTAVYLGSRILQAWDRCWDKAWADRPLLPSAAAVVHPSAPASVCAFSTTHPLPVQVDAKCFPVRDVPGGTPRDTALPAGVFKAQTTLLRSWLVSLTEMVLLCHLARSRYSSALSCPWGNIAISQGWVMVLLKIWMEKLVSLWYCYLIFFDPTCKFLLRLWFVQAFQKWLDVSEGFYKEMFHLKCLRKSLKSMEVLGVGVQIRFESQFLWNTNEH